MLELGIVIFIVLILLFIVFFGGLSKDATVPGAETGAETGAEADSLLVNDKKCKIIKTDANGQCGYIAIMYKLEQLNNNLFKTIFNDKFNKIDMNRLLSYNKTDVELFYKEIIDDTLKEVKHIEDNTELKRLNGKKVKEIDQFHFKAISNKFKVRIYIHEANHIIKFIPSDHNGDIHLLKTGGKENGHYDLLDC